MIRFLISTLIILSQTGIISSQNCIFFDDFATGMMKPEWDANPGPNGGVIEVKSGIGNGDNFAVRLGRSSDGNPTTNTLDLPIDLLNHPQVEMSFWIRDFYDDTDGLDGISFSNDGGITFTQVLEFKPGEWCEQYGQFPPIDIDKLASDFGLSLNSQFVISFQQHGSYDFNNASGNGDGLAIDDVCVYVPDLEYRTPPFCDDFESGQLPTHWAWRFADETATLPHSTRPSNLVEVQSGYGHESSFAARMGKRCDDGASANALDLHLNLAGLTQAELTFWIRDYFDETHDDDGIYLSNDGGVSFAKAFDFKPGEWCEQYGQFPPLDLDQLAEAVTKPFTDKYVVRFQQYGSYDFNNASGNGDGLAIDDVCVYVPDLEYRTPPFCDGFETGLLPTHWAWRFADETTTLPHSTRPSNLGEVQSGTGHQSSFSARMGKRCDDGASANALDLHLNLAGKTQVELSFWIRDYFDETDDDDGIYLSNDGGVSFAKAFDFKPGEWCEQYGQFPPLDLDQLAEAASIPFTDKYVVRFQQYGSYDFNNASGNGDGLAIDDVCVYVPDLEYRTPPFCDDFEAGLLPTHWAWRFADETTTLPHSTRPSNLVEVKSGTGHQSSFSARMGKRCDDGASANALDLHLNLAGQTQVELSFWIRDYVDETHDDDGIYLSNDGGILFEKALDFEPSNWNEQYFQFPPIDLDQLAEDVQKPFTDKYVVRFQQYGSYDFNNNSGNGDGLAIDDLCVTGMPNAAKELTTNTEQIKVYPNPTSSTLNIVFEDALALHFSNLKIYDTRGRLMMTQQLDGVKRFHEVDISLLGDGVYLLRLENEQSVVYQKFVKVSR